MYLMFGGLNHSKTKYLLETGEICKGTIKQIFLGNKSYQVTVEFEFRGQHQRQTTGQLMEIIFQKFKLGDQVTCYVDRNDPTRFVILETLPYKVSESV